MINIEKIKEARKILSDEFNNNKDLWKTKYSRYLCESMGALDILIQNFKKQKQGVDDENRK